MTCAFDPCTCTVDGTDAHCAPSCRMGLGEKGEPCKCGHDACSATVGEATGPGMAPG